MDLLVMRAIGRGLMIVAAIGMIIYGIVLSLKKQESEEKSLKLQKDGRRSILLGIVWLVLVLIYMFV